MAAPEGSVPVQSSDFVSISLVGNCQGLVDAITNKLEPVLTDDPGERNAEKTSLLIDNLMNLRDSLDRLNNRIHV